MRGCQLRRIQCVLFGRAPDKRFKCFIAHDGIFNTQQQYYETEEMWFPNWDLGAGPWRKGISADPDNAEKVNDQQKVNPFTTSPHLYVDRWDTPILLHPRRERLPYPQLAGTVGFQCRRHAVSPPNSCCIPTRTTGY